MNRTLTTVLGAAQAVFGVVGTASAQASAGMGAEPFGNIFNIVSGAAMGLLGSAAKPQVQQVGVPIVSGLNGLVGILGAAGLQNIGGLQLNQGLAPNLVNIGIAVLGFVFTFLKNRKKS